jgi:autotransporter-associated beta strand protein
MNVLYLTNNPTHGGAINILKGWLPLSRADVGSHTFDRLQAMFDGPGEVL